MSKTALLLATALLAACSRSSTSGRDEVIVVDRIGPSEGGQPAPPINPSPGFGGTDVDYAPPGNRRRPVPDFEGLPGQEPSPAGGAPVPEPTTVILVGSGLGAAALLRRRRRRA